MPRIATHPRMKIVDLNRKIKALIEDTSNFVMMFVNTDKCDKKYENLVLDF